MYLSQKRKNICERGGGETESQKWKVTVIQKKTYKQINQKTNTHQFENKNNENN